MHNKHKTKKTTPGLYRLKNTAETNSTHERI